MRSAASVPVASLLVAATLLLGGCGGEWSNAPGVSVPVQGTIQVAPFAITGMTLATTDPGDRFSLDNATARVERPDGTSDDVDLSLSGDGTTLTLGQATLAPAGAADLASQQATQADVRVVAQIEAPQPGQIERVTLRIRDPGDTLDIAGAKAHVERPDGSIDPVDMTIGADRTEVALGPFKVAPMPGSTRYWYWLLNRLVIEGPVSVQDGPTGSRTEIGSLAFSFGVYKDNEIVVPTTVRACIPTIGVASDRRVVVEGLKPDHDYVWASVTEQSGGQIYSRAYLADDSGQAVIPDTLGQVTAERLSGPNSHIEMCFGCTYRKTPPPIVWPPIYDGNVGPGGRSGLDDLIVEGTIRVMDGATGTQTQLGRLRLGFEVLTDGTVVAPARFTLSIPTRGAAGNQALQATGLEAGDFAQLRIVDNSGRVARSPVGRAQAGGSLILPDAGGGVTAANLSGANSSLSLFFARTDANGDGHPDWF